MIYLYRFLYAILRFILYLSKPFLSKKTIHWLDLRSNKSYLNYPYKKSIWFHSSSGEIEYCKSVITEIKKLHPESKIIISYSSSSAESLMFNIKDSVDFIFPLPWDSINTTSKMLQHLNPSCIVFSRTDFWPELIFQISKNNIPTIAIAMFPNFNFINKKIYKWLLSSFTFISTVSLDKSNTLSKILNRPILTYSDTRFDQVFNRLNSKSKINLEIDQKKIIFASTWPEDEKYIFPCLERILNSGYRIILCPHDVKRVKDIKNQLSNYKIIKLSDILNSKLDRIDCDIMLIDQVGYLADLYRFTEIAFVGGSFKNRIHSVMEPLAAQNLVLFGPYYKNNPEAIFSLENGLTTLVNSSEDIINFISSLSADQVQKKRDLIQEYTEKQKGSSILIAQEILKIKAKYNE